MLIDQRRLLALLKPPLHLARWVVTELLRLWIARPNSTIAAQADRERIKVVFLLAHAYGMGGTIRTVLNLAGYLAPSYDVEVVTVVRRRQRPFFPFPAGVTVRALHQATEQPRSRWQTLLARTPSLLMHEEDGAYSTCSAWTDIQLARMLRSLPPAILVTTRPGFSLIAARLAPPGVVTVAQEHVSHRLHRPLMRKAVTRDYRRLHALAVLTEDDRDHYAQLLAGAPTQVVRIPNALSPAKPQPRRRRKKVVVTAGRLAPQKRFGLLIDAFAKVAEQYPDWQLRIFGSGSQRDQLRRQVTARNLEHAVFLKGRTQRLAEHLSRASVFVLPAHDEGFGLVIIEAMSCGLPVVSFDSGGPSEIITHTRDGILVPDTGGHGDVDALAGALLELISDQEQRERMGTAALATSRRFDIHAVGSQWDELFHHLASDVRQ